MYTRCKLPILFFFPDGRIHILSEICIAAIVADESYTYGQYYNFSQIFLIISYIKKLFEVIAMLFVEDRENIKIHSKLELRTAI